jgi:hypothetical protein
MVALPGDILQLMRKVLLLPFCSILLVATGCGDADTRSILEADLPTTTGPTVVYSEDGEGPKYVNMYFEAERRWPDLTPDQWAQAATHLVDGGTWDEATMFMVPTTTISD